MFCYIKDQFCYIQIPKNASTTYNKLLSDNGWQRRDLFANDLDLKNMILWGLIQDPEVRHTKGLSTFLLANSDIDYSNPNIAKLLISGVFDAHTYSMSMMLGPVWNYPIHWIPLDHTFTDYSIQTFNHLRKKYGPNDLTQMWFDENGIKIDMSSAQYLHQASPIEQNIRKIINQYKFQHQSEYQQIVKNYLSPDIIQYRKTLNEYAKKFGYSDIVAPVNVYEE